MLTLPADLQTHLDSQATTLCTCWQIARKDGVTHGFTDHDNPLEFSNIVFEPTHGATGSASATSNDLAIDNSEILAIIDSDALSANDLKGGRLDNAEVYIWQVNWANTDQRVLQRKGTIGEITRAQNTFRAEIRGITHTLDQTTGRLYQKQCDANVGDERCGVNLNDPNFHFTGTVLDGLNDSQFIIEDANFPSDDWFVEGRLTWQSGENAGLSGFIKRHAPQRFNGAPALAISLWQPTSQIPQPGDSFTMTAGCDRHFSTCREKFANVINFRGFAQMPGNDFIIQVPTRGETNDGGQR